MIAQPPHRPIKATLACLFLFLSGRAVAGFWWSAPEDKARWRDRDIKVDGYVDDWRGIDTDDAGGFDFAFLNDGADLYFYLNPHTKTTKAQLSGAFGQSVTVWLDPKGGKDQALGIRLAAPDHADDGQPRALSVYGVAGSTQWADPPEESRVSLVMGSTMDRGALEGRVPLAWLGEKTPRKVSLGLSTSEPAKGPDGKPLYQPSAEEKDKEDRQPQKAEGGESKDAEDSGGPKFSMGGGVGGRGGGRRGGPHRPQTASAEPVSVWVEIWLARPPKPKS